MASEKAKLYQSVDNLRQGLGLTVANTINIKEALANIRRIDVEYHPFITPKLCGVAMVGNRVDTIILNQNRTPDEQNFDGSHEFLHLFMHRSIQDSFNCFTTARPQQSSFLEWQANEGAAQFLVPYQDFIPRFLQLLDESAGTCYIQGLLADHYGVTPQVINIRISNLSHEIDQYRAGIPMGKITLLSKRQQIKAGIQPTPYSAICDFALRWDAVI